MSPEIETQRTQRPHKVGSSVPFLLLLSFMGGLYLILIGALIISDFSYLFIDIKTTDENWIASAWNRLAAPLFSPEIRYAIWLSLITCTLTAILSLWVAVPLGYLLSRQRFPGRWLIEALLDIPIVLPPLVIGISLLIVMQTSFGRWVESYLPVTYAIPSIILAQFTVACAFAVRTMRVTFDGVSVRQEQVALTLGCSRAGVFWLVVLPQAQRGIVTAGTLAWARALGEFGPILVFSGATRLRTEVLPTTVFLELSVGNLNAAVAVSLLMVLVALAVLVVVRVFGLDPSGR